MLRQEHQGGVTTLILDRPDARNALSATLIARLDAALAALAADPGTRVVVIGAAGPAFCAGHDLREMRDTPSNDGHAALFTQCSRLMQRIAEYPKPTLARVHGIATAAGCQLVASCDIAVAAESARFATPGVDIGLFCSTPAVALSRAVGRRAAMDMLLTGTPIPASRALAIGLVSRVVPDDALDEAVNALARQIAAKSPTAIAIGKAAYKVQADLPLTEAYQHASSTMARNMMEADAREGIAAFLQRRPPVWGT